MWILIRVIILISMCRIILMRFITVPMLIIVKWHIFWGGYRFSHCQAFKPHYGGNRDEKPAEKFAPIYRQCILSLLKSYVLVFSVVVT